VLLDPSINALLAPLNLPKDDPIPLKVYVEIEKIKLFKDIGSAAEMNRVGLARGKKDQLKRRNRQILHKMEVRKSCNPNNMETEVTLFFKRMTSWSMPLCLEMRRSVSSLTF